MVLFTDFKVLVDREGDEKDSRMGGKVSLQGGTSGTR